MTNVIYPLLCLMRMRIKQRCWKRFRVKPFPSVERRRSHGISRWNELSRVLPRVIIVLHREGWTLRVFKKLVIEVKSDHRSKFSNSSNWKEEAWKEEAWENQGFNGIRTRDLRDTGAMLHQPSKFSNLSNWKKEYTNSEITTTWYYVNTRRHVDSEKFRVPDGIWTHDPPWSSRMLYHWATGDSVVSKG